MATKCYNRNTPEYQSLKIEYKNTVAVDGIISGWQALNTTEELPTIEEAKSMIKSQKTAFNLKEEKVC